MGTFNTLYNNKESEVAAVSTEEMLAMLPSGRLSFAKLRSVNAAREREWEAGQPNGEGFSMLFLSNAMGGEAGEAQNVVKKLERERLGYAGSRATVADLGEELADVVIYADLLARKAGIDLGAAIIKKFNETSDKLGFETKL